MTPSVQMARRGLGSPLPCNIELPIIHSGPTRQRDIEAGQCRWIISNEHGGSDALMCGAECEPGCSFCPTHMARVFVKVKADV